MRWVLAVVITVLAPAAYAQVQSRPADAPIVTAQDETWYLHGDPLQFAGNTYYKAGAAIFFDGNRMVRTGYFNGIPLYADTMVEPYSLVYVPIARGLMQPYELPRSGNLAGTTGSHAPSFPVSALPGSWSMPMAPAAPTSLTSAPIGPGPESSNLTGITSVRVRDFESEVEGRPTPAVRRSAPLTPADVDAARERVWVEYNGQRWVSAGAAIPLEGSGLEQIGTLAGFPVYTRPGANDSRIYLPALTGLVTPYKLRP
jgi:hypothetical protein